MGRVGVRRAASRFLEGDPDEHLIKPGDFTIHALFPGNRAWNPWNYSARLWTLADLEL